MIKKTLLLLLISSISAPIFAQINSAVADISSAEDAQTFEDLEAVDNQVLDKMRGGFVSPEGIKVDVGVGKAIFVDGMLQLQDSFTANNIHFNGKSVSAVELQNIDSNVQTIIQNNIDNKTIQSFTVVDVNVKNVGGFLEAMRGLQDIRASQNVQVLR